jgi:hypothetical protein
VEPVVAGGRLIPQTLVPIDLHALHGYLLYTAPRTDDPTPGAEPIMPETPYTVYVIQSRSAC